jgi:hypothetical protein
MVGDLDTQIELLQLMEKLLQLKLAKENAEKQNQNTYVQ